MHTLMHSLLISDVIFYHVLLFMNPGGNEDTCMNRPEELAYGLMKTMHIATPGFVVICT